jgi:hypothetical protein
MARPEHPIDWEQVEKLCQIQCTQEEIASVIGCCLDTLQNRCAKEFNISFSEFFAQKKLGGKASLRRKQWALAEDGNATMLVWLGKNVLGQTDKQEVKVDNSELVEVFNNLSVKLPS